MNMIELKYQFTGTQMDLEDGTTVYRIRAAKDFGDVKVGDLGGWIESEKNLSNSGSCWVADEAIVAGNARIVCDAIVSGKSCVRDAIVADYAIIKDNASILDSAYIGGNSMILGNAKIMDEAIVIGTSIVKGDACVCGNAYIAYETITEGTISE